MEERMIKAIEPLGWQFKDCDDRWLFENWSPAGQYLPVEIDKGCDVLSELKKVADDFDEEENVDLFYSMRGKRGVPSTIRELLADADAIKEMYQDLVRAVESTVEVC